MDARFSFARPNPLNPTPGKHYTEAPIVSSWAAGKPVLRREFGTSVPYPPLQGLLGSPFDLVRWLLGIILFGFLGDTK